MKKTLYEHLNPQISVKPFTEKDIESPVEMSNAGNREILYKIGKAAGEREIKEEHFNVLNNKRKSK